jgi:hypothetical protein
MVDTCMQGIADEGDDAALQDWLDDSGDSASATGSESDGSRLPALASTPALAPPAATRAEEEEEGPQSSSSAAATAGSEAVLVPGAEVQVLAEAEARACVEARPLPTHIRTRTRTIYR